MASEGDNNNNNDEAALLMARLASQFGDMDLTGLLDDNNNNKSAETTAKPESDEESSLAEPTPEELLAWQQAQFQKGKEKLETKQQETMTPIQKRLQMRRQQQQQNGGKDDNNEQEDWEHIPAHPDLNGQESFFFPSLPDDEQVELLGGVHPLLQQLATKGDPEILGTKWRQLYSSSNGDGLSFFNLLEKLKGYDGPTILLLSALPSVKHTLSSSDDNTTTATKQKKRSTFGFFTTTTWKESTECFGTEDCFLFTLQEETNEVTILRPQKKKANQDSTEQSYMVCYPSSLQNYGGTKKKTPRVATTLHGIGIGGTPSKPRVHLTETLEECRALSYCSLFEPGDLLVPAANADSLYYFDVECIEVWGVGGDEWINQSLQARQKAWEQRQANLQKARTVDKKQFLDDFRSGIHNMNATATTGRGALFEHMDHMAGHVDVCK